ncbi:hypothetical protein BDZ88DRAFT_116826 [Geranomyces variabilis]|nr:hypothetical protein BDZ88DRAFT_116826 [Geranomyces variabilis]KAJ3134646.1 hypothetical protein HDU90_004978 [Geranomyces variabilis]
MQIPVESVIPLQAGSVICGIALTLSTQTLTRHGVSFRLVGDADRQKFLSLLCFIIVVAGIISLGLNQTLQAYVLQDICLLIIFWGVQLGLCCLNHNTIVRFYLAFSTRTGQVQTVARYCLVLYPLSLAVLIPIYIAFPETVTAHAGVNRAPINARVFKPLNVALVFATEALATASDILLLYKVFRSTAGSGRTSVLPIVRSNLLKEYAVVWTSVVLDVILKLLIFAGQPVLFDSQVSNLTLILRARTNLQYGLTLQEMWEAAVRVRPSSLDETQFVTQQTETSLRPLPRSHSFGASNAPLDDIPEPRSVGDSKYSADRPSSDSSPNLSRAPTSNVDSIGRMLDGDSGEPYE